MQGQFEYKAVAASQTDTALGSAATGGGGEYLEQIICVVATAATSSVTIKDGSDSAITILPANVGGGVGTYNVYLGMYSRTGAWTVTTGAGVSIIATGNFR